ncbi:uncharacterized protein LOC108273920 isoform X1 [Ictalurus punctatus]|uniref:Uncharacterized protein LOC108273920 isoform X1 n=1 Tax=Ictalurus punctatus TaxID=7998 RepID=A0A2D0S8N5_ICTPU|nr:uncharacterized protein LOC108273920 isoform X1 [Ictalurus punctatus]
MPHYTSWDSSDSGPWVEAGDFQHFVPDPHVYPQKQDFTPITQCQACYGLPAQPYYASWDSTNSEPWAEDGDVQHVLSVPHVYHQEQDLTPSTQDQAYYSLPAQPYYASWDSSSSEPLVEDGDVQHLVPAPHVYNQEQDFSPSTLGQVYYSLPAQPYCASWDSSSSEPWFEDGDVQNLVPAPHVYHQEQQFTPSTQGQVYYSLPAQPYYASWDSSNSGPCIEDGDVQHVVSAPHVCHQEQDLTPSTQDQAYYSLPAQPYYPSWDSFSCSGPCVEAGDPPHPNPSSHVYHQEQIFTPSTQDQQIELPGMAALSEDQNCSSMPEYLGTK